MRKLIAIILVFVLGGIMLTTSAAYKTAIANGYQVERITGTITLADQTVINITEADLLADSLYIDEQCVPGDDLAIGGAIASEMGFKLVIPDVSPYALIDAIIEINYWVQLADTSWESVSLGVYKVETAQRNDNHIDVVAYDLITNLDKYQAYFSSATAIEHLSYQFEVADIIPKWTVRNSAGKMLTITYSSYFPFYKNTSVLLTTNTTDTLSVTKDDTTRRITIALANTTASKNTAALIQTALIGLGTFMGYTTVLMTCVAGTGWDTTTIATGEIEPKYQYNGVQLESVIDDDTGYYLTTYPNSATDLIPPPSSIVYTSRDIAIFTGQFMSLFIREDRHGMIELVPLHKASADRIITRAERFRTSVNDSTVKVTAVQMTINGAVHTVGTTGLTMVLNENPLMKGLSSAAIDTALTNILNDITQAEYRPFTVDFCGDPSLQPGDWITLADIDDDGTDVTTLITHSTWRFRGTHTIQGVGRTTATITPTSQTDKSVSALTTTIVNPGQIKFPATQNASTDVNTLDDYEEGTFTPIPYGTTSAGTGTYSYQLGEYVKIGSACYISGYVEWSAHTGTGKLKIGGFPFTVKNSISARAPMPIVPTMLSYSAGYIPYMFMDSNSTSAILAQMNNAAAYAEIPMQSAAAIYFSGWYKCTA